MWYWRRLLKVPWTARRSNQSIVREINPEYSLKVLMLKQAPVFWSPDSNSWLIRKVPDAGKDWGQKEKKMSEDVRGWDGWMVSPMQWTRTWANFWRWWGTGKPGMLQSMVSQRVGYNWWPNNSNSNTTNGKENSFRGLFFPDYSLNHAKSFQVTSEAFQNIASGTRSQGNWLLLLVTDKNKFSPNYNLKKRQRPHIYVLIARHIYPWIHTLQRSCFDLYSSSKHKQIMFLLIWFCPFTSDQNRSKEGKWAVITREEDASCVRNVMENGERKTIISFC